MPNFICNAVNYTLPASGDGVEFLWEVKDARQRLIFCRCEGAEFFLITKPKRQQKNGEVCEGVVVKSDKITRPANLGLVQKALFAFKNLAAIEVKSEAFKPKDKSARELELLVQTADLEEFVGSLSTRARSAFLATQQEGESKELSKPNLILTKQPNHALDDSDFQEAIKSFAKFEFDDIIFEIGFGSGRHLLFQATNNPKTLVIGVETYQPSIRQVNFLATQAGLKNVVLLCADARLVLASMPSNSLSRIFLHFPVPWAECEKRRVVSSEFVEECQRALCVDGHFELRTDERSYAEFALEKFLELKEADLRLFKNRQIAITSKYEARWNNQGKDIFDLIFTNQTHSEARHLHGNFAFGEVGFEKLKREFSEGVKHFFKDDEIFVNFEANFSSEAKSDEERIVIRVSFGGFMRPSRNYIVVSKNGAFYLKPPLNSAQNQLAHAKICEFLAP